MSRRSLWSLCLLASISWTGATSPAQAEAAPDVVVFCEPTLQRAVTDVAAIWRKETGIPVRVFTSPTWALLEQMAHGVRSDLVIGEGEAAIATATERHLVNAPTLQRLWRNQLVAAARSRGPDAAGPSLAALAGKAPIAIVDPVVAVAGAQESKALTAMGLADAVHSQSIGVVDTADAGYLLAQGTVQMALVYATDVAGDPDFVIVERLPAGSYDPIVYWIAETAAAKSPNAQAFAAFLRRPQAQDRLRADGLEVLP